jgi:hypothetical protein
MMIVTKRSQILFDEPQFRMLCDFKQVMRLCCRRHPRRPFLDTVFTVRMAIEIPAAKALPGAIV